MLLRGDPVYQKCLSEVFPLSFGPCFVFNLALKTPVELLFFAGESKTWPYASFYSGLGFAQGSRRKYSLFSSLHSPYKLPSTSVIQQDEQQNTMDNDELRGIYFTAPQQKLFRG